MSVESPLRGSLDQRFGLIETLRFQPGEGCLRMERHLSRLERSAKQFDRPFDVHHARKLLDGVSSDAPLRLRLYLDEKGTLSLDTHLFTPLAGDTVWRIAVSRSARTDPGNPLIAHKTSRREIYEAARADYPPAEIDEVILLNMQGRIGEGTITTVFLEHNGILLTPPLGDGLLRGILREELLERAMAREQSLTIGDLQTGRLFVGNSLRGLIAARLVMP